MFRFFLLVSELSFLNCVLVHRWLPPSNFCFGPLTGILQDISSSMAFLFRSMPWLPSWFKRLTLVITLLSWLSVVVVLLLVTLAPPIKNDFTLGTVLILIGFILSAFLYLTLDMDFVTGCHVRRLSSSVIPLANDDIRSTRPSFGFIIHSIANWASHKKTGWRWWSHRRGAHAAVVRCVNVSSSMSSCDGDDFTGVFCGRCRVLPVRTLFHRPGMRSGRPSRRRTKYGCFVLLLDRTFLSGCFHSKNPSMAHTHVYTRIIWKRSQRE